MVIGNRPPFSFSIFVILNICHSDSEKKKERKMEMSNNNNNNYKKNGESSTSQYHDNPRKKRTRTCSRFMRNKTSSSPTSSHHHQLVPNNITRPCTECGRKFWSWKALFGHMRCHPERQWRGIIPPPNFRRPEDITEEDHEVATCLLMLANGRHHQSITTACTSIVNQGTTPEYEYQNVMVDHHLNCGRFECSSCKKVFGSHQALGGHRASHKNVKGCYAINKNDEPDQGSEDHQMLLIKDNNNNNNNGHKCSICFRIFSSGQALGGHMRCHWEKVEEPSRLFDFDLNLAAPVQDDDHDDDSFCLYSSGLPLDLRLGL